MSAYSETETKKLREAYLENPCLENVARLSVTFNRPKKSIIAKLVKEGVYQSRGYVDKRGLKPKTKLAIVRELETVLGVKLPGLDKSPKSTLLELSKHTTDLEHLYRECLLELTSVKDENRTLGDIVLALKKRNSR